MPETGTTLSYLILQSLSHALMYLSPTVVLTYIKKKFSHYYVLHDNIKLCWYMQVYLLSRVILLTCVLGEVEVVKIEQ